MSQAQIDVCPVLWRPLPLYPPLTDYARFQSWTENGEFPPFFLPSTLFAIVLPFKFSRGKNSWDAPPRRDRRRPRRLRCRNLRKKRLLQKPRRWRRSRWAAASLRRSVGRPAAKFPSSQSARLSLARTHGNAARAPRATVPRPPTRELRNLRAGTGQAAAAAAPAKEKGGDGADEGERERRGKKGEKGILKKATAMARRFRHIRTIHSALPRAIAAFPLFWEMSQNTLPL